MFSSKSDLFPVGGIILSANQLDENDGWLLCDGRSLKISEYGELYAAIKDTYTQDTSDGTFNIPSYLGRFLRGAVNNEVGVLQGYSTKRPNGAPFKAIVNHLPKKTHVTHGETAGGHTGLGSNNPYNQETCTSGGDKESRPKNIYLSMYIKCHN